MRALTLWRPWTDAILYGGKDVENRTWAPPSSVIGELIALHAGKHYDIEGAEWMEDDLGLYVPPADADSPVGIVGVARITGFRRQDPDCSPWAFSDYHWMLADVKALSRPVWCRGALGLWRLPSHLEAVVRSLAASPSSPPPPSP